MYIAFYSTSDVFAAEELCLSRHISYEIAPTPVTDKAYCGVCLKIEKGTDVGFLKDYEYQMIEGSSYVQVY